MNLIDADQAHGAIGVSSAKTIRCILRRKLTSFSKYFCEGNIFQIQITGCTRLWLINDLLDINSDRDDKI